MCGQPGRPHTPDPSLFIEQIHILILLTLDLYEGAIRGRIRRLSKTDWYYLVRKEIQQMAKCAHCGKSTTFGHAVSFSKRTTNRPFHPNLQKVTIIENGQKVQKVLCTKCIRTLAKTA